MLVKSELLEAQVEVVPSLPAVMPKGRIVYDDTDDSVYFSDGVNWSEIAYVPVGTIFAFYDFNGALTFNTNRFAYCNGQIKNVGIIGPQTLPDLSNRYLVGFGTEGGADVGAAAWATAAVGNANHQIDLSHNHQTGYNLNGTNHWWSYQSDGITAQDSSITVTGNYLGAGVGGIAPNNYIGTQNTYSKLTGSATQSIQPRSIRVRWLMRIK